MSLTSAQEFEFENNIPLSQEELINEESNISALSTASFFSNKEPKKINLKQCSAKFQFLKELEPLDSGTIRTNDDIHTTIQICPLAKCIIDTPQFQRLRKLRQLGTTEYVYMNAIHTRFEHSLGVMHLSEKLCRRIQKRQPQFNISEKDVLCVKLAGLLHDLGHGPFSHAFESVFNSSKTHEEASLMMIDALLAHLGLAIDINRLDEPLKQVGPGYYAEKFGIVRSKDQVMTTSEDILTSRDWIFIKECIIAEPLKDFTDYIGRLDPHKEFLYDIVCNRHNGLDVDKIDYFARDKRKAFGSGSEINIIFVDEAIVAWSYCNSPQTCFRCLKEDSIVPNHCSPKKLPPSFLQRHRPKKKSRYQQHLMICYPIKLLVPSIEFFQTRFSMFANVYTHKTASAVEYLVKDILRKADELNFSFSFYNKGTKQTSHTKISQAIENPDAYLHLNDSILEIIYQKSLECPRLAPCRDLVNKLKCRNLYKLAHMKELKNSSQHDAIWTRYTAEAIEEAILNLSDKTRDVGNNSTLTIIQSDVIVQKLEIHHGRKKQNPVSQMGFITKDQMSRLNCQDIVNDLAEAYNPKDDSLYRAHLPQEFLKRTIRIYCRDTAKRGLVQQAAQQFWSNLGDDSYDDNQLEITEEDTEAESNIPPAMLSQEEDEYSRCSSKHSNYKRSRYY